VRIAPITARCWTLALVLGLAHPREARAEDAVSYKYQDYRESSDRIAVRVHGAMIEKDLGTATKLRIHGVIDTIAGATPTGEPERTPGAGVPLATLTEERKAWSVDVSHQFGDLTVALGGARSTESDYKSTGWSINTFTDFNSRNTTLALGIAGTIDDVKVFYQLDPADKRSLDVIAGITQLLDPRTSVSLNVTRSHASGYLSDPYKLVEQIGEVFPGVFLRQTFPENRPDSRTKWIVLGSVNRALPGLRAAVDASYRFHDDDFGITSHTLNLEWYQKLGERVTLRPHVRLMQQSAADFYRMTFTGASFTPSNDPTGSAPFYSSDYRLSDLRTTNYGLKLVWEPRPNLQFDAAIEKYEMKGRDGVTSASAYPQATIFTIGGKFAF
jgi:hypothetical protein